MLWADFTSAFFGFLQASQFCATSQNAFDPNSTISVCDVTLLSNVVILRLKSSKTDQFCKGYDVRLATSGKSVCPFLALREHLIQCADSNKSQFTFSYGRYLSRQTFSDISKSLLLASIDKSVYSSHSFRIGAETCAADKNTPAWLIKALGRLSSNCFEDYIKVPSN